MSNEYQVLFFTHTGAIKFSKIMKKNNISCELMPVPRTLSSSCGVSACIHYNKQVEELISDQTEKIFQKIKGNYSLIYTAED
jgi:hypothetical protein